MPTWPASLPQKPQKDGYNETAPTPKIIRSQMGNGKEKVRRRTTSGVAKMSCTFNMTDAQTDTLDGFFANDVKHGVLPFTWTHPRTGVLYTDKFRLLSPPSYVPLGEDYRVTLQMELLP